MSDQASAVGAEAGAPDVGGNEAGHNPEPGPVGVVAAEKPGEGAG
jgi:hypothetical protein